MSQVICPSCGKLTASARELSEYHYKESGLENVRLSGGVTETKCSDCGATSIRIWKEPQLLQVIANGLLMAPRALSGPEWRFLRRACEMSQAQLASALKMPRRETIADREGKPDPKLNFPEEVGSRWILLRSFLTYLTTPGNSSLESAQLEQLMNFGGFFRDFATKVDSIHRRHRITAAVSKNRWMLEKERPAA